MKEYKKSSGRGKFALGIGLFSLVLVAMAAFLITAILMPYLKAKNTMDPDGIVTLTAQTDGSIQLAWPEGENTESYTLQVTGQNKTLFSCVTSKCTALLPADLPVAEEVTITVSSQHSYRKKQRPGTASLQVKTTLQAPVISDIVYTVDPDTDQVNVTYTMPEGGTCQVFSPLYEAGKTPCVQLQKNALSLEFGQDKTFAVPAYGETCEFTFRIYRSEKNLVFYGVDSGKITLTREDFLGNTLSLEQTHLGSNQYLLQWNQTKGDGYILETSTDGETWQQVASFQSTDPLSYQTGHLTPFTTCYYRITALTEGGTPACVTLQTAQKTVYSTVWPVTDLQVYAESTGDTVLGTLQAGQALCVLEEKDGRFGVAYDKAVGYIDSNLCLINLPEYLGELCSYDITNSYSARYTVHEFTMDQITGTKVSGYGNVQLYDGSFLVPLLYPSAQKLVSAAQAARAHGYRLKIYDAFQPRTATADLHPMAADLENVLVPKSAYTGEPLSDLADMKWIIPSQIPQWVIDGYRLDRNGQRIRPNLPSPPQPTEDQPDPLAEMTTEQLQKYYLMRELTYGIFMTDNGRYAPEDFFPRGKYIANAGLTLDVTLEGADGTDIAMQTRIYDMSWFSETARNNENAQLLASIMEEAGFASTANRWWHFGDTSVQAEHTLLDGISAKGWVKDDLGWRYRLDNGRFYRDCTEQIDGFVCTFDENGYADIDKN